MIYDLAHRATTPMSVLELTMVGICEQRKWIGWEGAEHGGRFRITDREAFLQDWRRIGGKSRASDHLLRQLRYYFQLQSLRKACGIQCYQYAVHALTYMIRKGYWKVSRETDYKDAERAIELSKRHGISMEKPPEITRYRPEPKYFP